MALVKTAQIRGKKTGGAVLAANAAMSPVKAMAPHRPPTRSRARPEQAAERIGAATEELAAGVAEASAAAEELRSSLEQISVAAEEAAGAAQESQSAINSLGAIFTQARNQAELSRRKIEGLQTLLLDVGGQIDISVASVQDNAARQLRSVEIVSALETQAANIGEITRIVGDISDQTNLLALNAAIEAARAGEHGRGFAVVADEVRAFAEASEKSAREVQSLAEAIGNQVRVVADRIKAAAELAQVEAEAGRKVIETLDAVRAEMGVMAEGSQAILVATIEAETGAREAQRGAEQVASAAEEQSSATVEAQRAVQQQSASLDQSQQTAQALAVLAENLQNSSGVSADAEQVGSAAEELSAAVQELSGAAGEILIAIDQISRGSQAQAAATQQSTTAMTQIEKAAASTRAASAQSVERGDSIKPKLAQSRQAIARLMQSVEQALDETKSVTGLIAALEISSRRIEKIVDAIALVAVQTNMLAVSGSVEAARSGEAGRGFAVVSSDIRNLARDSAENADRVKDVVRLIQDQIGEVRRDLDQIGAVSQAEMGKNKIIIERLGVVDVEMSEVHKNSTDILAGSDATLHSVREVLSGTQQIAAAAEEAGSAAAQAATAAREQARGAEDLAAAIEEIASLADELQTAAA
jgi:methyl-accepting chemotaxis protein